MRRNIFKAMLVERGISIERFAEQINLHTSTLYRKLREPDSFTLRDMRAIKDALDLSDDALVSIFFNE